MTNGAKRKRMKQSEVIDHLSERYGLKRSQVKDLFDELASLAASEVRRNGEFVLPGFGKIVLATRKERIGRNPATGATIQIPAKTSVKFRIGKAMKDSVVPKK